MRTRAGSDIAPVAVPRFASPAAAGQDRSKPVFAAVFAGACEGVGRRPANSGQRAASPID
jgi:hypothetical protein